MLSRQNIEKLRQAVNDNKPSKFLHNLNVACEDHPDFISIQLPWTDFVDYLTEYQDYIIDVTNSEAWGDFGYCYAVFDNIDDYIQTATQGKHTEIYSDEGFRNFDAGYAEAINDIQSHEDMFDVFDSIIVEEF